MPRRNPRQRAGRPSLLTPQLHNQIVDLVQAGNYLSTAAATVRIGESTIYSWLHRGQDAQQAIQDGETIPPSAHRYLKFLEDVTRARARAEAHAVDVVQRAMEGGYVLSEEPVLTADGVPVRDSNGDVLMIRKFAPPDGKLALSYLAVTSRARFGPAGTQMEPINGGTVAAGVGPEQDGGDAEAALAERVRQHAAARAEERRALEAGDVVDAEVIP